MREVIPVAAPNPTQGGEDKVNRGKSRTRLWFLAHSWLAMPIWVFLFFVCVTGTIATVDKEIMWLIDPTVRAVHEDGAQRKPINAIVEDIRRQIPGASIDSIAFGEPYMALRVRFYAPDIASGVAWVNPYSGEVQRVAQGLNFSDFVVALHGWLLMPWFGGTAIGWYAVTALGFPMLGSAITGMVVYKRFWRAYTQPRLRLRQGARVFWGDLHRLAGAWTLWFVILIALTGLWFMVRGIMYDLHMPLGVEPPDIPRREAPLRAGGDPMPVLDLDGALAAARQISPGATLNYLALPEHALGTITVYSRSAFPLLMEGVWVHPYSGDVVATRDASIARPVEVISSVNASLHYGNFGGLWVKLIWTFFGILLSTMVASGTVIWFKRTAQAARKAEQQNETLVAEAAE